MNFNISVPKDSSHAAKVTIRNAKTGQDAGTGAQEVAAGAEQNFSLELEQSLVVEFGAETPSADDAEAKKTDKDA